MYKRLFCLSILIFSLSSSLCFAASPGINLINDPASANWVPDPAVKNWMTIIPETPSGLAKFNSISASNIIIRIHAGWTDIGKKMLDSNANQTQAANDWCNVLNSQTKNIYIEPFNELEQDYERVNLSGNLDLDTAIVRANSFISKLQSCLTHGTIISPALDPQNANFPKTSAAFSYFSIISYHPYREDTAKNYSSGVLAGKQFIFTEVGVDNNGVVYDDCEFIKFFCGKGIAAFWQGQSNILAYTLFAFAPGNYGGSWKLTNSKVTNSLKSECSDTSCVSNNKALHALNRAWGYIPPVSISNSSKGIPNAVPTHPEVKSPEFYSNSLTDNLYSCTYKVNVSQTFDPIKISVGTSAPSVTPIGVYQTQSVNQIEQTLNSDQNLTNPSFRNSSIHFAKSQAPDLTANETDLNKRFLSYGNGGENAITRYLPEKDKLYLKGTLIEEACLSLDGKHDVIATDEPLAWSCPDGPKNLLPKPSNVSFCRPITICEVGWNFLKRGKPVSYEVPKDTPLKRVAPPDDVILNMVNYFDRNGYIKVFKFFVPVSNDIYDLLYKQMPLVPRGSVNSKVQTQEAAPTGGIQPTPVLTNRTLPLAAPLSSSQVNYALKIFNSKSDQAVNDAETKRIETNNLICTKIEKGNPSVDKPTPVSLWTRILQFFGIVVEQQKTFSGEKEVTLILPKSLINNIKQDEGFLKSGLPSTSQKDAGLDGMAESSTDNVLIRDPGLKDSAARNLFDDYLKPQDWQKADQL